MALRDYKLFESAEECANAAESVFQDKKWHWKGITEKQGHIPDHNEILATLLRLAELSRKNDGCEVKTGRLIVVGGRYGYARPIR